MERLPQYEETFGGPGAAVISEGLWTRRYGRLSSVIGRALAIGGRDFPIVGVMPSAFSASVDVWLPIQWRRRSAVLARSDSSEVLDA